MPNSIINKLILNGNTYDMHDVRIDGLSSTGVIYYNNGALSTIDISGALKFIGAAQTDEPTAGQYVQTSIGGTIYYIPITNSGTKTEIAAEKGDVFTVASTAKEYICTTAGLHSANAFIELGDESSYVLKSQSVSAGNGITLGGNTMGTLGSIAVKLNEATGSGLSVDENGLQVKLQSSGGLDKTSSGLKVAVDGDRSTSISTNKIGVNVGEGLEHSGNSGAKSITIKLDTNPGLVKSGNGLKAKLASNGGLTVDSNGLAVQTGQDASVFINQDGNLDVSTGNGLDKDQTGEIYVKAGQGIKVNSSGVSVDLADNDSGLTIESGSGGGLKVALTATYNSTDKSLTFDNYPSN